MRKQIHFFALRDDLLPVLEAIERDVSLQYVRMGHYPRSTYDAVFRGAKIPNLGRASAESSIGSEAFLVASQDAAVNLRPIVVMGAKQYAVDQLLNPDTVTFTPGGFWNDDVVLSGRVATVSDFAPAQDLMKRFYSVLNRRFSKAKTYLVGPEALALLKAGMRLTSALQSPPEFDLKA